MDYSADFKWRRARAALAMLLNSAVEAVVEHYGPEALDVIARKWRENNLRAVPRMMELVGCSERTLATVARIIDFTDTIYGVEGEWTEVGPDRAVKSERSCPLARQFRSEVCTRLLAAAMEGIARGVTGDDGFTCRMPRCLAAGDDRCEIIIEKGDGRER